MGHWPSIRERNQIIPVRAFEDAAKIGALERPHRFVNTKFAPFCVNAIREARPRIVAMTLGDLLSLLLAIGT